MGEKAMMTDWPKLTEQERRDNLLEALHQAAYDGQKTTLARIHYSWLARAADEIERLGHKVYELLVELREAEASVDIQRDYVEADVHKLRRENERLAAENDWLRKKINFAHVENTHSNTSG
jgi:predicted  nucleic acid-binding Zn-ribbon protein